LADKCLWILSKGKLVEKKNPQGHIKNEAPPLPAPRRRGRSGLAEVQESVKRWMTTDLKKANEL